MVWYLVSYYLLIAIGIGVGMVRYRKLIRSSRLLVLLLIVSLLTELIARLLGNGESFIVYTLFLPIEYALLTWIYTWELQKPTLLITILVYTLLTAINAIFIQPDMFNSNLVLITQFVTSAWALLYLRDILRYPTEAKFTDFALFWASCGLLFFNTSCLFVYGAFNFVDKSLYLSIGPLFRVIRVTANHILYFAIILSLLGKQNSLRGK